MRRHSELEAPPLATPRVWRDGEVGPRFPPPGRRRNRLWLGIGLGVLVVAAAVVVAWHAARPTDALSVAQQEAAEALAEALEVDRLPLRWSGGQPAAKLDLVFDPAVHRTDSPFADLCAVILAQSLGVPAERVRIVSVRKGSVVVVWQLLAEPAPAVRRTKSPTTSAPTDEPRTKSPTTSDTCLTTFDELLTLLTCDSGGAQTTPPTTPHVTPTCRAAVRTLLETTCV